MPELSDCYENGKSINVIIFRTTTLSFFAFSVQFPSLCIKSSRNGKNPVILVTVIGLNTSYFSSSQHFQNVTLCRPYGALNVNLQFFLFSICVLRIFKYKTSRQQNGDGTSLRGAQKPASNIEVIWIICSTVCEICRCHCDM